MFSSILRLWEYLLPTRKKQLSILFILMIITSFAEVVSIGAVLPFLGALVAPESLFNNTLVQVFVKPLSLSDPHELLFPLTVLFVIAAIFSSIARVSLLWLQTRLGHSIGADLSIEVYRRTLYQPYQVHLSRNSSEVIAGISSKTNSVVGGTILPLLTIASSSLIILMILSILIAINPEAALMACGGFGFFYFLVMFLFKKRLKINSQQISRETNQVIKALQEGLGGIRDVLIDGSQKTYCDIYRLADTSLRRALANNQVIGNAPRFVIEAVGISLIASLAYSISGKESGFSEAIPVLGAFALGAQRLLPVMQQFYQSWSSLRGGQASLNDVLNLISQPIPADITENVLEPLKFKKSIRLKNISFQYSETSSTVLNNINLEIKKGSCIGFVGSTGSGKSTLLDIIMGLLMPTNGVLEVDDVSINIRNYRAWQDHIAHVPQAIFLADNSIAENIAFGIPFEKIDMDRVRCAAEKAQIAQMIESWKNKYQTLVGERGVRLSGGQRQRIGIARALYKQADLIVFDEATSALDNETESAVIKEINSISKNITILMVAHRLSTLSGCDVIYKIVNGKVEKNEFML